MAFFGRVGNLLRTAANTKISSEVKLRSFPSVFQAIRCFSGPPSPPSAKLFVGGISYNSDEQSLREVFSKYGEVADVRIIIDRETGRSKGFGFVTYNTVEEASSAIQALDGQDLHGRRVGVNFANERPRTYGGGGGGFDGSYGNNSYGGGGGYQGSYGNSTYNAPSSYGGGGYDGPTSGVYGGNNVNYAPGVGGGETNSVNYGSPPGVSYGGNNTNYGAAPAVGDYGGNNVSYGAADTVNYGSAPGVGDYGGGNNANYGSSVGGGESSSVNYGGGPGVDGYGGGNNAYYGAAVGGQDSNSVNYGAAPTDGGYGATAGFGNSTPGSGPSNGFASGGGLGYGESGQENFRSNDHEVDAFAKRG